MRNGLLVLVFLLSTCALAEGVTIHLWQGRAYADLTGQATWNTAVNAYVVTHEVMDELRQQYPEHDFYANANGFLGRVAGFLRWHYKLVSQEQAVQAVHEGVAFSARDVQAFVQGLPAQVEVHNQEEVPQTGPNGERVFHANPAVGPGYYYREKHGEHRLIHAATGRPVHQ